MTSEQDNCRDCGGILKIYEIDYKAGKQMKKCPKCGLYHYSKKDRRGNWILVKVVKPDFGIDEITEAETPLSKNVFIVHGREHQPMKDLKVLLYEFGLNPIVLHERASAGLTLAEKLEKHSTDIGFAFIILTPDDVGCLKNRYLELYDVCLSKKGESEKDRREKMEMFFRGMIEMLINRARQNVIFEMGYFWALLKRKRVCSLLKGTVEKPSDIEGIVYIPFKKSIEEVRYKIVKELNAVGYEIKI